MKEWHELLNAGDKYKGTKNLRSSPEKNIENCSDALFNIFKLFTSIEHWHLETFWFPGLVDFRLTFPQFTLFLSTCFTVVVMVSNINFYKFFRPYLDTMKHRCVDSCSRERCMSAVQEFYRKIPRQMALDVAFCLCK